MRKICFSPDLQDRKFIYLQFSDGLFLADDAWSESELKRTISYYEKQGLTVIVSSNPNLGTIS